MEETISILDVCKRYLNPNNTLDPEIFDETKKMHSDLRKKILKVADIIVKNSIYFIPGLRYHDICLIGSSAGYHYYEKSDLDIRIIVSNGNCDFLTKNPDGFRDFINTIKNLSPLDQNFFVNGRFVDVKLNTPQTGKYMGLYSISKNIWISEPDKTDLSSLNIDDIMDEYTKRYNLIREHILNIKLTNALSTLEGIYELQEYRENILRSSYISSREFVIAKLLQKSGITREIAMLINESKINVLSLG